MVDIYLITNLLDGKQYVGQTTKGYMQRWKSHCRYANRRKQNRLSPQLIDTVIDKYGIENFKIELLETVPFEQKDTKEQFYIRKYDTYNNGYNLTIGGDYNPMLDDKIKKHHLDVMRSETVRFKMSSSVKKAYTDELRMWFRNDTKQKWLSKNDTEKAHTISGFIKYNNSKKQQVAIIDENATIIKVFESGAEACKFCNRPVKEAGHILLVCDKFNKNGKRAKYFGYHWTKL